MPPFYAHFSTSMLLSFLPLPPLPPFLVKFHLLLLPLIYSPTIRTNSDMHRYLVLLTTKGSNIVEDLQTLYSLSQITMRVVGQFAEEAIRDARFEIIFAFDEVISMGYSESISPDEVGKRFSFQFISFPCFRFILGCVLLSFSKDLSCSISTFYLLSMRRSRLALLTLLNAILLRIYCLVYLSRLIIRGMCYDYPRF